MRINFRVDGDSEKPRALRVVCGLLTPAATLHWVHTPCSSAQPQHVISFLYPASSKILLFACFLRRPPLVFLLSTLFCYCWTSCTPPPFFSAPPPPSPPPPPAPSAATPSNAPADKNGVRFTSSAPSEYGPTFVTCVYQGGAGFCTYFPAHGSFSSGSSDCPQGVAQDSSVTTDAPSTAGADPTPPASDPASDPISTPAASDSASDPVSTPAVSTPAVSTPASSASAGATANPTVLSPGPSQTGGARALSVSLDTIIGAEGLDLLL
ncbi:hypothetical protein B0H14DRAFT_3863884 [Mycena olivaceomarginata]|nr:hypothetical protein B0H14DRAFT_3863884 [Mycena olivaceomarginata]